MMKIDRRARWIGAAALVLSGCYAPAAHLAGAGKLGPLEIIPNAPASVSFDRDSTVRYAKVRLVLDTLYAWKFAHDPLASDSVAIAIHRIRAVQQDRLDFPASAGVVVVVAAGVYAGIAILIASLYHVGGGP